MSDRYTVKDAERALERLAAATGHWVAGDRVKPAYKDVGGWSLDYAACYGGCVISEQLEHGITQPFGSMRRSPREFCDAVSFAINAIEQGKR